MPRRKKNYKPLLALAALAVAALAAAAVTFTNVTYWLVNATMPPAMKYAGADTSVAGGKYVKVSYYYDSANALNITRISVVGFTGDPVNYTDVVRVCNYYGTTDINATLIYKGAVSQPYGKYVNTFYVYWTNPYTQPGVGFIGSTQYPGPSPSVTIKPGRCAYLGVYVKIDPSIPSNLADGQTVLATYEVDIQMSPQ
ncbi:MAG: hypothetical protein ABWK05_00335 [Pyrobaculum sp.]